MEVALGARTRRGARTAGAAARVPLRRVAALLLPRARR